MGYEQREDAVGVGGAWNVKHTHTHTHSVTRDTQGGWNLGQGSDPISTHVGVAPHQFNYWAMNIGRTQWGAGDQASANTHTVSTVIHRVDGITGKDRKQY